MSAIFKELGMSTSTEMPFPATVQPRHEFGTVSAEQMAEDAGQILDEFASDYVRMAKGEVFYGTIGC